MKNKHRYCKDTLQVLREAPQKILSIFDQRSQLPVLANKQKVAAIFMIVLNVTFFIPLLLEVIGEWAGCDRAEGASSFFFCFLHCKYIFYFDVKPKCGGFKV